jgi:predicted Zn-dependent peptidase
MNAYTSKERTAYYSRVPAGEESVGVDLLLESVVEPALRAEDLSSERAVILEELAGADDDPADLVDTRLFEAYFPGHPLGREVIGRAETVAEVGRDQIVDFLDRYYRGDNLVVAAAGVIDHERLAEAAERWLGGLPRGGAPTRTAPSARSRRRAHVRRRTEQTHLSLAWPGVGLHDEDRFALTVLEHVLGDGPASRLFQEVREQRGLAYTIGSSLASYADVGVLTVYVGTAPERVGEVLALIGKETEALAGDGVTAEELAAAQGYVVGTTLLGLEEPATCMSRLGYLEVTYGKVEPVEAYLDRIRAVTVEDVARVAGRCLGRAPVVASVGPRSARQASQG